MSKMDRQKGTVKIGRTKVNGQKRTAIIESSGGLKIGHFWKDIIIFIEENAPKNDKKTTKNAKNSLHFCLYV